MSLRVVSIAEIKRDKNVCSFINLFIVFKLILNCISLCFIEL